MRNDYGNAHFQILSGLKSRGPLLVTHNRLMPDERAKLVIQFVQSWGLMPVPDGETKTGWQKLKLISANELVTRACDAVAKSYEELEARGWLRRIPSYEEIGDPENSPGFVGGDTKD